MVLRPAKALQGLSTSRVRGPVGRKGRETTGPFAKSSACAKGLAVSPGPNFFMRVTSFKFSSSSLHASGAIAHDSGGCAAAWFFLIRKPRASGAGAILSSKPPAQLVPVKREGEAAGAGV